MLRKKSLQVLLAIAACWAGASRPAGAAVEVLSDSYGSRHSPLTAGESEELSFGTFNTSLGTLESITIDLFSHDTVRTETRYFTTCTEPYRDSRATIPITVTALDGLAFTTFATAGSSRPVRSDASVNVPLGDFSLYESSGPQTFDVSVAVGEPFIHGGSGPTFEGTGTSYGTVDVIYTYSPVPEPPTGWAGLAATTVCGIGAVQRIRRNRA
jgi:hypothetical protein